MIAGRGSQVAVQVQSRGCGLKVAVESFDVAGGKMIYVKFIITSCSKWTGPYNYEKI